VLKLSPDHPFEFSEADVCSDIVAKLTASLSPIYSGTGWPEHKTFIEIREMLADGSIDILGKFGDVFRAEFESLRAQQF
jgi:hypothetical protein